MQISRIRLSDKTSRLHPRRVASKRSQTYEPEVPVKVREWIGPAFASPDFVLGAQPPTQPHRGIAVNRPVRFVDGAYLEVVRPSAQRAIQRAYQLCGILPGPRSNGQLMDIRYHALDALLRWPISQAGMTGSRRIHSPERVAQKVELSFRALADSCLLLVPRDAQLAHDLAPSFQCLIGTPFRAEDHQSVGIGHDTTAEALRQPKHLPSQHEPAHVEMRQ